MTLREESSPPTSYQRTAVGRKHGPGPEECDLWLVDHLGSTLVRCRRLDSSGTGMQLRVPRDSSISVGQRYEVCPHLPGERPEPSGGLIGSAWVTVIRAENPVHQDQRHVIVHVRRIPIENPRA